MASLHLIMDTHDFEGTDFPSSPSSSDYSSDSYSPNSSSSSVSFLSTVSLSMVDLKKADRNFEDCFHSSQNNSGSESAHSSAGHWQRSELSASGRKLSSKSGKSKRRHDHHHQVHQRHAANMRERKRMQSINDAFEVCFLWGRLPREQLSLSLLTQTLNFPPGTSPAHSHSTVWKAPIQSGHTSPGHWLHQFSWRTGTHWRHFAAAKWRRISRTILSHSSACKENCR